MVPADFLIGPDLIIQVSYYGSDIGDHRSIEKYTIGWAIRPKVIRRDFVGWVC